MNDHSPTQIQEPAGAYQVLESSQTSTNNGGASPKSWQEAAHRKSQTVWRVEKRLHWETTGESRTAPRFGFEPTSDRLEMSRALDVVEAAVRARNDRVVSLLLGSIPWDVCPAEDLIRAIRAALAMGLHPIAWKLAALAAKRFPNHGEVQKIASILSPARVINTHVPPDPDAGADIRWLKEFGHAYQDQWVALKGGKLLATAPSLKELTAQVGDIKGTGILITRIV
jgi:hypothetical protein